MQAGELASELAAARESGPREEAGLFRGSGSVLALAHRSASRRVGRNGTLSEIQPLSTFAFDWRRQGTLRRQLRRIWLVAPRRAPLSREATNLRARARAKHAIWPRRLLVAFAAREGSAHVFAFVFPGGAPNECCSLNELRASGPTQRRRLLVSRRAERRRKLCRVCANRALFCAAQRRNQEAPPQVDVGGGGGDTCDLVGAAAPRKRCFSASASCEQYHYYGRNGRQNWRYDQLNAQRQRRRQFARAAAALHKCSRQLSVCAQRLRPANNSPRKSLSPSTSISARTCTQVNPTPSACLFVCFLLYGKLVFFIRPTAPTIWAAACLRLWRRRRRPSSRQFQL